ncbi:MAG: hypothetical protein IPG78_10565 [Ignavibacteria bacterium]|nr:hypothetical protein [Ignavibacteria bacterium]
MVYWRAKRLTDILHDKTAIFKQHQNKGIYKSLLPKVLDILKEKGFQKVYSRHSATNNQIIIPKLKQVL